MAETGNLIQIAKVLKSNGTDGELVLSFLTIDPEDIDLQEPVFIYFDGLPVPFFIDSLVRRGNTKALVHLTDIESGEDAEEIVGQAVYIADDESDFYEDGDYSFLVGWQLFDGMEPVGEIADFLDIPGNPCIELVSGEVIPLHEDLIEEVDEEHCHLFMNIPAGLI